MFRSNRGIVRLTTEDVIRLFLRHNPRMRTSISLHRRHRFPAEIISHCVWLYFRFALSFRDVEEMLAMRGVSLSYETVREWCLKFGQTYANGLRHKSPRPGDRWHLDEVFLKINGRLHYLWRAVDQDGDVLDILVQSRRDKKAAKKFFRKLLKRDFHIRLSLDPGEEGLLNAKNTSGQMRKLIVEPVCENHVTQRDTLQEGVCTGFSQNLHPFEQAGVKVNGVAAAFEHDRLKIVIQNSSGCAAPRGKSMNMAQQKVLECLVEKELQIERATVREGEHEAGQAPLGAADSDRAEAGPISLRLLTRQSCQAQECFLSGGTQATHDAPQLHYTAAVTAVVQHLIETGSAQARVLLKSLLNEAQVRISQGRARRRAAPKPLRLQGGARPVSGCKPNSPAMVPIFQCSA